VKTLGSYCFAENTILKTVVIPQSVTSLGSYTFRYCTNLEYVVIPTSIKTIPTEFLLGCTSLKSLTIPWSVKSFGYKAFRDCTSLSSFSYLGTLQPTDGDLVFSSCNSLKTVCVPSDYVNGSFFGMDISRKSSSSDDLHSMYSSCFDVTCSSTGFVVRERYEALLWNSQTNDCVEYQCNNQSGFISWKMCNNTKDDEFYCMDEKCVQKEKVEEHKWEITIEIEETDAVELNTTDIMEQISKLSGIDIEKLTVGIDLNDEGQVISIIVYVDEEDSMKMIVEAVEDIPESGECEHGILCYKKTVHVKTHSLSLSISGSSLTHVSLLFCLMVCTLFILLSIYSFF